MGVNKNEQIDNKKLYLRGKGFLQQITQDMMASSDRGMFLMKDQIYGCCKELRLSITFAENALSMSDDTSQDYLLKVFRAKLITVTTSKKTASKAGRI